MLTDLRARFADVRTLLVSVADGLAAGNTALASSSVTPYGSALAVKAADVTVDFILSSEITGTGLGPVTVGANTLLGIGTTAEREQSHATIVMHIVPIELPHATPTVVAPLDQKNLIKIIDEVRVLTRDGKMEQALGKLTKISDLLGGNP